MAIKTKDNIMEDGIYAKGAAKDFYKYAALLVTTYDEVYLREQRDGIQMKLKQLNETVKSDTVKYNGTADQITSQINECKKKLKTLNYLFY